MDKIREQFEVYWARQLWAEVYEDVKEQMFIIWKASRADVVVDLPSPRGESTRGNGFNEAIAECQSAIEAQGLKVQP